jgi:hypothetical protein
MKKIILPAMLSSLFSLSIDTVEANVSLNDKGIGQVLIYPYYTVNNDMNTLISLTNTTDKVKAVKIKFLEGKNNRDTLIFSIYIAPFDEWTAGLVPAISTIPGHIGESTVKLITNDNTCTIPENISGHEFRPYAYEGDFIDEFDSNLSRVTEGQIQVFEMGNVVGEDAISAMHSTQNCNNLERNWMPPNGKWVLDSTSNIEAPNGKGGLFGSVHLINIDAGVDFSYNAEAIQGYSTEIQHETSSTLLPNLNSGNSRKSNITTSSGVESISWEHPFQAVSSLFMTNSIYAEYIVDNNIGANTEVVLNFPTKEFFTDPSKSPLQTPVAPFTSVSEECESAELFSYNRESSNSSNNIELCTAINTIEFITEENVNSASTVLGSNNTIKINTSFDKGWANIVFNQSLSTTDTTQNSGNTYSFKGLPVIGFTIQKFVNANLAGGVLANYAGLFKQKGTTDIEVTTPQ